VSANLAALRVLRTLQSEARPTSVEEQRVLARWAGWGATPAVFDPGRDQFAAERAELQQLLTPSEYRAAARTTLNAHYTDAALAATIWGALITHGFLDTGGRVLEPGCGSGTFLGLAPASASQLIGVELDPSTAAIAAALYPHAQIRAESFADTRLPSGSFDLAIGNVPFGKTALHDKVHNAAGHAMHNHFILKSLAFTRPGGVVAVLTSHWTMDATNPAARREIAALADLVTAIRLPGSAHERAAGTQVVTDLLVLRRRHPDAAALPAEAWELVERVGGDDARPVNVNRYFTDHPQQVIGSIGTRSGPFGPELDVTHAGDTAAELAWSLGVELGRFTREHGALFGPPAAAPETPVTIADAPVDAVEEHLAVDGDRFTVVRGSQILAHPVPATQARELRALLELRDIEIALLAAEAATTDDTEHIAALRAQLNDRYDAYTAAFGPINRIKTRRTGRVNPDTGEPRLARIRPPQGGFRNDPHSPAVYALENYDAATGTATKSAIFTERTVAPRPQRLGADTAEDAVAICLDTHGEVRLADVARLLGRTEPDARAELGRLVFNDPDDPERLIPAAEYLSGNVRIKLAEARAAATRDGDERWADNIDALTAVQPVDLTPAEITVRLGASWISAEVVAQFLTEVLDDPSIKVENPGGSTWSVKGNHHRVLATTTFGTGRVSAVSLAQSLLEQRVIKVYDEPEPGLRIPNLTETVAAQEKAAELNERFADWVWEDPDRATRLARTYNDTFNAIVLRSYDGAHRQFPGLAVTIQLRPHQVSAVVRMLSEPTVLLAHEVGAGKTLEMIVGCMELRRLGMVRKPAIVVPNHMLEQFSREWMQAYPQARILAAGIDDLTRDRRRLFVARVATGDWDAVILSRSAFQRLPLTADHQQAYYDQQLATLRTRLDNSRAAGGITIKRLEGALQRAEERLKDLTDSERDPAISFENTGVDYLAIDEAHGYKNLQLASNIPGVAIEGSQRASDLDMKLHYLRERHGHRVATFATATPIANSVAEAYTMQRYLRPDILDAAGLTDFDVWAATFGEIATDLELTPDGSGYKMKSRFAKFRNVPELLRMWHLSADIKTAEDLNLPTPAIAGGAPETVVVPASGQLTEFMRHLAERADRVQAKAVDPSEDNILKVASHGRMAALDLRLLPHDLYAALPAPDPGERTKLEVAADRIAAIHHQHAEQRYPNHPAPGALQLVFCDLGTPDGRGWNAYAELRSLLVDRGVPAERVRFMHEARNDREKGELFAAARTGRISVLIGSTEKMGVGTNVQARAVALHHLECPWRPADLAQRDGRAIRHGNLNEEVALYRYVTESSFDGYTWQTVERKARFIAQVMRGKLDVREIEDVGDVALSYAEVKALACGDPRILEKARVDTETTRLERLYRAWTRTQRALEATLDGADRRIPMLQADLARLDDALGRARSTRGEDFLMTVGRATYDSRASAAAALRNSLALIDPRHRDVEPRVVAQLGGFDVLAAGHQLLEPHLRLELADVPRTGTDVGLDELRPERPLGIITRLENRVAGLTQLRGELAHELTRASTERDRAAAELGQPFPHEAALHEARRRGGDLADELATEARAPAENAPDYAGQTAPAPPSATSRAAAPRTSPHAARGSLVSDRAQWRERTQPRPPGPFAVWDMRDGRYGVVRQGSDGLPQAGVVGPAHVTRAQADAYAAALNAGADEDQAQRAALTADPTGYLRGGQPVPAEQPGVVADHAPPGGWRPEDQVPTPPARDTSSWPSVRQYPAGTRLTVHAIGQGGPGRRLGHGTVVEHPGPHHVVVESPYGTRRIAPISHVSPGPADPSPAQPSPARPAPPPDVARTDDPWREVVEAIDPTITEDPAWPALAAALQRAADAGYPARQQLAVLAGEVLPDEQPARALHYRLIADTEAAAATGPASAADDQHRRGAPPADLPGTTPPTRAGLRR
jgi:N12 class adenine-specific DNA methylase